MKQPQLGQKILELRKQKGFTQEELVAQCNINVRTIQRIEAGEVNPRSYTVKIILEVESLDGKPGVYSARFAGELANAENNMQKLLTDLEFKKNRKAQFKTAICLNLDGKQFFFEGICKGDILKEKQGDKGFGYDPIFKPEGFSKSFAIMNSKEKNTISHRGVAIQKLVEFLKENY